MRSGYTIENRFTLSGHNPNFITVSNYSAANKVVNISSVLNLSNIKEDVGMWKIKYKKNLTK